MSDTPGWMQLVPDSVIRPNHGREQQMLSPKGSIAFQSWLFNHGLPRPSLYCLECERLRRGMRRHLDGTPHVGLKGKRL